MSAYVIYAVSGPMMGEVAAIILGFALVIVLVAIIGRATLYR